MGKKGQNKIPDRWEQYSKVGNPIPGTNFICFKVPLKPEVVVNKTSISRAQWFTPADLLQNLNQRGLALGLLIDLTNTDRYYDPKDVTYTGTKYVKINVTGQELPSLKDVKDFFTAVDDFENVPASGQEEEEEEGVENTPVEGNKLIGVHCTHGVNRTGYLVCRYLIERKGWSAKKAVHAFNAARGHEIEKQAYLAALREAERKFRKNQQPETDLVEIRSDSWSSSSSSSSEEMDEEQQQAPTENLAAPPGVLLPQPAGLSGPLPAGWQLFQQMMLGVAQMQAMMGGGSGGGLPPFPTGATPVAGTTTAAAMIPEESSDDEEEEETDEGSDEETDEDSSDDDEEETEETGSSDEEEDGEAKSSSSTTGDGKKTVQDQQVGDQASSSRQGWELGGKVELKPKMTKNQKRRARRRERREEFKKMRRGKFWEIREMQKEKYGI